MLVVTPTLFHFVRACVRALSLNKSNCSLRHLKFTTYTDKSRESNQVPTLADDLTTAPSQQVRLLFIIIIITIIIIIIIILL